jgi:hypothetical protein
VSFEITVYSQFNGAVRCVTSVTDEDDAARWCQIGDAWLEGRFSGAAYRVDLETRQPVPLLNFADVVVIETNRIANIPTFTETFINGARFDTPADGEIILSVAYPQTISGMLLHPCYIPYRFEVPCAP